MDVRGSQSNTRDLRHHWWKDLSDPSVGEGPEHWERLPRKLEVRRVGHELWITYSVQIPECSRSAQSEMWAMIYGTLSGALPRITPWDSSDLGVAPGTA